MSSRLTPVPFVIAAWLVACGIGMWQLLAHATVPGTVGQLPQRLPPALVQTLAWSAERPLLVVAAHPQCTCLPATFDELTRVLGQQPNVDLRVLVYQPSAPPPEWDQQAFDTLRGGLPASTTVVDLDAGLALAIGAETSGHISLYTTDSTLAFAGGITAGRGHVGENSASRALARAITKPPATTVRTAVFGCPLTAVLEAPCHDDG